MVDRYKLMTGILFTALWIQLCWGFVCTDLITALEPTRSYVNMLCDLAYVVLGVSTIKNRRDTIVLVSFCAIGGLSAFVNHQGCIEFVNGCRDFVGLLFAAPIIRYMLISNDSERFVKSFDKMLYIFLWLQVPCLVSQFIRFGAGDAGGGSLGKFASGQVSTLIYIISFYLINKEWNENKSYFQNLWANRVYVFLLFPTFLNETKISVLYFMFYFVLLIVIDKKVIGKLIFALPLSLVLFCVAGYIYLVAIDVQSDHFDSEYFTEYLIGDDIDHLMELAELVQDEVIETDNLWVVDLPRYGRFVAVPEILSSSTGGGMLLGAGVGQFKGGQVLSTSEFASKYQWFLQGSSIMFFFIVIQLGLIGLIWMMYDLMSILFTSDKHVRANNIKLYMLLVTTLILVYNDQYRSFYICMIMFYICLRGLQPMAEDEQKRIKS
jgi:hypothetical protein